MPRNPSNLKARIEAAYPKTSLEQRLTMPKPEPKEPSDLWHHYDTSVMDVNAGMKLYPKQKK